MRVLLQALLPSSINISNRLSVSAGNGTSLSMQIRGRQFCVNRNYSKGYISKQLGEVRNKGPYSKFIYAIPLDVKNIEDQPEGLYRRSTHDPEVEPISDAEYEVVKCRFMATKIMLRKVAAQKFLDESKGDTNLKYVDELLDPYGLELCSLAELLHFTADVIDEAELGDESRSLSIIEIEQILQALKRVKRRLEFLGVREKDINVNLFTAFDNEFLLAQGKSVYKKRRIDDIESQRMTNPVNLESV